MRCAAAVHRHGIHTHSFIHPLLLRLALGDDRIGPDRISVPPAPQDMPPPPPPAAAAASESASAFSSLGLDPTLTATVARLGWSAPTAVQREAIPQALAGRDVIGLAQTGSGKTAAFALPILDALLKARQAIFAVVLAPTR